MFVVQQYLLGLVFFGVLGFLFGAIRQFRELKKGKPQDRLTAGEWRQTIHLGLSTFSKMFVWWSGMYALVLLVAWIGQ